VASDPDRPFERPDAPWAHTREPNPPTAADLIPQTVIARYQLDVVERHVAILAGRLDARIPEVDQARTAIQKAHAHLYQLTRKLAGNEIDPTAIAAQPPMSISTDYVAWVLGDERVDHFTAELIRLVAKADPGNRARLRRAFPHVVQAYEWWMAADLAAAREEGDDGR
jgi:hypothetical protein